METSKAQRIYNAWLAENYDGLMVFARRYHRQPHDLLHHVYLRIYQLPNLQEIMDGKPWGYHILALHRQATTGVFAKAYKLLDGVVVDTPAEIETAPMRLREETALILSRLPWFDRTLFEIKLTGYNMHKFAKESKISPHTVYYSLRKTSAILKKNVCRS